MRTVQNFLLGLLFIASATANALDFTVTVEDVPSRPEVTRKILETLLAHHVPEVYGFVSAGHVDQGTSTLDVLSAWVDAGYPLGNQTYNRIDLNSTDAGEFIADIERNEFFLRELSRGMHFRFLRYPYLHEGNSREKREAIRNYLSRTSYSIAQVTVETNDYHWAEAYNRCHRTGDGNAIRELSESFIQHMNRRIVHARRLAHLLVQRDVKYILRIHATSFMAENLEALLHLLETEYSGEHVGGSMRYVGLTEASRDPIFVLDPGVVSSNAMTFLEQLVASREVDAPAAPRIPERIDQLCRQE